MAQLGINSADQPPGIKSSISCSQNIPQGPVSQGCSIAVGQLHGSSLSQQQRRHPLSSSDVRSSGNLDKVSSKKHLDFNTACSWKRKYYSRLRVWYLPRLNRLATQSKGNHTLPYKLQHGSFHQPPNNTATPIPKLATRPRSISYRCSNTSLEVCDGLCSLQSNCSSSQQGDSGQCRSGSCRSNLVSSAMVAHSIESYSQQPCVTSTQSTPHAGSLRFKQGTSNVPSPSSDRLSNLQQYYQTEGFPGQVTKPLLSATQSSTRKAHQSAWSRWNRGCAKGKINPVSAPLSKILEFLANTFSDGLEYRSINVLHSATSSTHSRINNSLVGQHPHVTKLMKGILNSRPPKPWYSYTWDVKKVTAHLASLGNNSSLSLKQLSEKLVMLFALACPESAASLAKLDLRY